MQTVTEPGAPRPEPDLMHGWTRRTPEELVDPHGRRWRPVRRRDLAHLTDDEWADAVVMLRRPPSGWLPCSDDGYALQSLLLSLGPVTRVATLLHVVWWWANDDDPHVFITRAVRDKRAHLVVLVPDDRT